MPNPPELFSSLKDSDKMLTWWGKLFISSRSRSLIKTANVCSYSGSTAAAAATKIKSCHSLSWAHMKKMYICRNISESYFWILLVVFNACSLFTLWCILIDTGILFRLPWSWTVIELFAHRWTLQWKDCLNLISCALLFLWYMYFVLSVERGIFRVKFLIF